MDILSASHILNWLFNILFVSMRAVLYSTLTCVRSSWESWKMHIPSWQCCGRAGESGFLTCLLGMVMLHSHVSPWSVQVQENRLMTKTTWGQQQEEMMATCTPQRQQASAWHGPHSPSDHHGRLATDSPVPSDTPSVPERSSASCPLWNVIFMVWQSQVVNQQPGLICRLWAQWSHGSFGVWVSPTTKTKCCWWQG